MNFILGTSNICVQSVLKTVTDNHEEKFHLLEVLVIIDELSFLRILQSIGLQKYNEERRASDEELP